MRSQLGSKPLWGLVNNAGIATAGFVELCPLSEFQKVVDVNLWGMVRVTQTFLPLIRRARGRIVNVASIAGTVSTAGMSAVSTAEKEGAD